MLVVQNVGMALRDLLGKVDEEIKNLPSQTHQEVSQHCMFCSRYYSQHTVLSINYSVSGMYLSQYNVLKIGHNKYDLHPVA